MQKSRRRDQSFGGSFLKWEIVMVGWHLWIAIRRTGGKHGRELKTASWLPYRTRSDSPGGKW